MRVLVTGGAGFLGQRLVRRLLDRDAEVQCLVRPSSNVEALRAAAERGAGRLRILRGSLSRPESYTDALDRCDVVFHVAAEMRGATAVLFANNVIATRHLVEAASQARVGRFLLVSSLAVYGTSHLRSNDSLDEECPLDPEPHRRDAYTYSKVAQEAVVWEAHRAGRLPLTVVRPGVIYGPGRDCLSSRVGLRLGCVLLRMGGRQQLPYTFVANCADGVLLAGVTAAAEGQAFNLIDDDLPTGRELLAQHRKVQGGVRCVPIPSWGIGPLSRLCEWYHGYSRGQLPAVLTRYKSAAHWKPLRYSNAKAKEVLGWRPRVPVSVGLLQTLSGIREDAWN
jgi:nucleoside-diphosphate-sugar epimerase